MKIFLISPVRMSTPENLKAVKRHVKKLEKQGHQVHWPIRDTDQNDPIGIKICDTNLKKIEEADEIHIWYLKESSGIHFDIGGLYMLIRILNYRKKVVFVNKKQYSYKPGEKSFWNVLKFLDEKTNKTGRNK